MKHPKPMGLLALSLFSTFSFAQIYMDSDTLFVGSALDLTVMGDLHIDKNSSAIPHLQLEDTLHVSGNVGFADSTSIAGSEPLALNGSTQQNLDFGDAAVPELTLDNANGALLTADAKISETLNLENGLLDIANQNLAVGLLGTNAGTISGGSVSSYVRTSGTGELKRYTTASTLFPVGDSSYAPAQINPAAADTFGARAENIAYASYNPKLLPFSNNVVRNGWYISGGEVTTADVTLGWESGRELSDFGRDSSTVVFYDENIDRWIIPTEFQNANFGSGVYSQNLDDAKNFNTYYSVFEAQDCGGANTTYVYNNGWNIDPNGTANFCDSIAIVAGSVALTDLVYARSITIAPGTSIDLGSNVLVVENKATVQADATGYGQLIGKIDGAADWQTYLASASPRWYNNAFPVSGKVSNISGALINISNDSASHNIYKYDATVDNSGDGEGDWVMAGSTDDLGTTAYQVYLSNAYGGSSATLTASGSLLDGEQSIPVTVNGQNAEGWNYIPNPFPSTLDFDEVTTDNPTVITKTYYVQSGPPGTAVFRTYNSTAGTGTNGGAKDLAPGQGFFVEAASSGNLTLDNSQRNFGTPDLYRTSGTAGQFLKVSAGNPATFRFDETVLHFDANFSNGKDNGGADAKKMLNSNFSNIYTEITGKPFVYNGLNENFTSHSEPLFFENEASGNYEIAIAEDYLPKDWTVDLEDKLTNKTVDFRAGSYSFSHSNGNAAGRFILHFNKSTVGLDELENASGIFAFTEEGFIKINMENHRAPASVKLYDLRGALLAEADKKRGGQTLSIKLKNQARGVYLLKVQDASGQAIYSQKVFH